MYTFVYISLKKYEGTSTSVVKYLQVCLCFISIMHINVCVCLIGVTHSKFMRGRPVIFCMHFIFVRTRLYSYTCIYIHVRIRVQICMYTFVCVSYVLRI